MAKAAVTGTRRSYRGLMALPVWGLYSCEGVVDRLVATVRARTAYDAADLFRADGLKGDRVRRIP